MIRALTNLLRAWWIRRRIADLRASCEMGRRQIENDLVLIDIQTRQIGQLECELASLGALRVCAH